MGKGLTHTHIHSIAGFRLLTDTACVLFCRLGRRQAHQIQQAHDKVQPQGGVHCPDFVVEGPAVQNWSNARQAQPSKQACPEGSIVFGLEGAVHGHHTGSQACNHIMQLLAVQQLDWACTAVSPPLCTG